MPFTVLQCVNKDIIIICWSTTRNVVQHYTDNSLWLYYHAIISLYSKIENKTLIRKTLT